MCTSSQTGVIGRLTFFLPFPLPIPPFTPFFLPFPWSHLGLYWWRRFPSTLPGMISPYVLPGSLPFRVVHCTASQLPAPLLCSAVDGPGEGTVLLAVEGAVSLCPTRTVHGQFQSAALQNRTEQNRTGQIWREVTQKSSGFASGALPCQLWQPDASLTA